MSYCDSGFKDQEKNIESVVKEFYGKKIILPDSLYSFCNDTIVLCSQMDLNTKKSKIFHFVSGDCSPCIHELYEWNTLHLELQKYTNLQIVFIIQFVNATDFIQMYRQDIPPGYFLLFDPENKLHRSNNLPSEKMFKTMLLNYEDRISLIGDPNFNKKIKDLYISTINKKCHENN